MDTVIQALKAAFRSERYFGEDDLPEAFELADEDDNWEQDGKYQTCTIIVRHIESGRCFQVHNSRSGSYHSDWYYGGPELGHEVKKVTKTIETWGPV